MSSHVPLFSPLKIRSITFPNRVAVSPMCQYAAEDGFANGWHFVHLGSRAVGGASLVIVEATAVEARGRITAWDLGLWKDEQTQELRRNVQFIHSQGSLAGIQLAHAGRKASTQKPWDGGAQIAPDAPNGWQTVGPSPIPFTPGTHQPHELSRDEIRGIVAAFADSTRRALEAGFGVVDIHAAHGYLLHQFMSPLANQRTDEYGGSFENRVRFTLEVTEAVRDAWPDRLPLFVRISATDWKDGGWDLEQSVELSRLLRERGVDMIDCSSGGLAHDATIATGPGYQVPFAERIRREAGIATGAVGMITTAAQANDIIANGQADMILLARAMLRDPYWALHAGRELGAGVEPKLNYARAYPRH